MGEARKRLSVRIEIEGSLNDQYFSVGDNLLLFWKMCKEVSFVKSSVEEMHCAGGDFGIDISTVPPETVKVTSDKRPSTRFKIVVIKDDFEQAVKLATQLLKIFIK